MSLDVTTMVTALYAAIDRRDAAALAPFLADHLIFQLGNNEPIEGRREVVAANTAFFQSIAGMEHSVENIWTIGDRTICNGYVQYTRMDGSRLSVPFATFLVLQDGKIADYQVYVDVSPL